MFENLTKETRVIHDENSRKAFAECDRRRMAVAREFLAELEALHGPANRPDELWENGVNLWRENKLNAIAIECRKVLLKIKDADDDFQLSTVDQNKLIWCIKEVRTRFYKTNSNREIVSDLISRAVEMTDAANKAAAVKILSQRKWWWY